MQTTAAISLQGVCKGFGGQLVLSSLSLTVGPSSLFLLAGANGAGKSTLVRILSGLLRPDSGRVELLGQDVGGGWHRVAGRVGVVPEELALFERLSVHENLTLSGTCYGLEAETVESRARDLLRYFELWDDRATLVCNASMGMRKKAAIAAALIHVPEVLVLDEPFSGLDVAAVGGLVGVLAAMRDRGTAILVASHITSVIADLWDGAAVLRGGILHDLSRGADLEGALRDASCESPGIPPWLG